MPRRLTIACFFLFLAAGFPAWPAPAVPDPVAAATTPAAIQYPPVILILLVFLVFAALMYLQKISALLALPGMAILFGLVAMMCGPMKWTTIMNEIVGQGAFRLHQAMVAIFLGATLGQVINKTGIAEVFIKKAAELAGDRPFRVALVTVLVNTLLFTVLAGLGSVIMVATILFPILLSLGIRPLIVAGIFLMSFSIGGMANLSNLAYWKDAFGLNLGKLYPVIGLMIAGALLVVVLFLLYELKLKPASRMWVESAPAVKYDLPLYALLTPLIPVVLVFSTSMLDMLVVDLRDQAGEGGILAGFCALGTRIYRGLGLVNDRGEIVKLGLELNTALLLGIGYGVLTATPYGKSRLQLLTRALFEGIADVAPAVALMMGIGMLLKATMHPVVSGFLAPVMHAVVPHTRWGYLIFFAILSPLALYRGPLNLWGIGIGIALLVAKILPVTAVFVAFMAVGQIQGICDPTNTHNVWIANYLKVDINAILRKTLPFVWLITLIGLGLGAVMFL